jgi:murein DD-endopeptidase MepM/ murein hydrolase activator NlpD
MGAKPQPKAIRKKRFPWKTALLAGAAVGYVFASPLGTMGAQWLVNNTNSTIRQTEASIVTFTENLRGIETQIIELQSAADAADIASLQARDNMDTVNRILATANEQTFILPTAVAMPTSLDDADATLQAAPVANIDTTAAEPLASDGTEGTEPSAAVATPLLQPATFVTGGTYTADISAHFGQLERRVYSYTTPATAEMPAQEVVLVAYNNGLYDAYGNGMQILNTRPINGGAELTSRFGNRWHPIDQCWCRHDGIDYAGEINTPILAAADGVVTAREYEPGGAGNYVKVQHEGGYETLYMHFNGFADGLEVGDTVSMGQVIGYMGDTGSSTDTHLHYEVRFRDRAIDPLAQAVLIPHRLSPEQMSVYNNARSTMLANHGAMAMARIDQAARARDALVQAQGQRNDYQVALAEANKDLAVNTGTFLTAFSSGADVQLTTRQVTEETAAAAADWAANTAWPVIDEHVLSPAVENVKKTVWNPQDHPLTATALTILTVGLGGLAYFGLRAASLAGQRMRQVLGRQFHRTQSRLMVSKLGIIVRHNHLPPKQKKPKAPVEKLRPRREKIHRPQKDQRKRAR